MHKDDTSWGRPEYLFPGMFATTAMNGNVYVTDIFYTAGGGICVYRFEEDAFRQCERLVGGVNTLSAAHASISPDERFLIFDAGGDLYVSFSDYNLTWSNPQFLTEINTAGSNMTASLSPDGSFLFYYANHDIYWVSTEILQPYFSAYQAGDLR